MRVGELFYRISEAGITLTCGRTEDRLNAKPTSALTPELIKEIKEHKMEIIQIMREDEQMRRTGVIQSERQVFELAREHFGLGEKGGAA
jgi:TubC N-terminal docking domain